MYTLRDLAMPLLLLPILGSDPEVSAVEPLPPAAPEVREYRYRLRGAVRPVFFWIGRDNVGAARITWREGLGSRVCELLIGSDPYRAPRKMNRWGWVREESTEGGSRQIGLMRKIDEETLAEAEAQVGFEVDIVFIAIRTEIADGEAESSRTYWVFDEDYSYYDLAEIRHRIQGPPETTPLLRSGPMPPDIHPGLLHAITYFIERAVLAATQDSRRLLEDLTTYYNFHAHVCELKLRETKWEDSKEYDGRRYERLVRLEFENLNAEKNERDRFTLICGTEGELRGVPVYMKFQPKWYFKTEGVIDASQNFEDPPNQE
jgi:hypothetical protein